MSEPTYTISITESERALWAKVMGGFVTKLLNAPVQIEAPSRAEKPVPTSSPEGA